MIVRTEKIFKRRPGPALLGSETVKVVTYWAFGLFPLYKTESIIASTELKGIA